MLCMFTKTNTSLCSDINVYTILFFVHDAQLLLSFKGFKLDEWLHDFGNPNGSSLEPTGVTKLMTDLGMTAFLLQDQCNQAGAVYNPREYTGWKNGRKIVTLY